jgi:hypothetical protein
MASCSESGITPGTTFVGTLLANGLAPLVPGIAWPGALAGGLDVVCATQGTAPQIRTPDSKKCSGVRKGTTGELLAWNFCGSLQSGILNWEANRHQLLLPGRSQFKYPLVGRVADRAGIAMAIIALVLVDPLAFHYGICFDFDQPIRIDKAHHLHDGAGGSDAAKELAVDYCNPFPVLYPG